MPFLVVTQALPGAGKTVVTTYLQQLGFVRLCLEDNLRKKYGKDWWIKAKKKSSWWWFEEFEKTIFKPARGSLKQGRSVVVDTVIGATKWPENHYRIENLFLRNGQANRYLLEIVARPSLRHKRIAERNRIRPAQAKKWDENYSWGKRWQPRGIPVKILQYKNNTPSDMETIKNDLKKNFGK